MKALRWGALVFMLLLARPAHALPEFAVESARGCFTCHVSPDGWENPELKDRKCSLNCSSCHVNPTGGGLKRAGGIFFGHQHLAAFGPKPLEKFTPGASVPGPASKERYAGLDPIPLIQIGGDLRMMAYHQEGDDDTSVFPMQADLHLALTPYNPPEYQRGRLTLMTTVGAEGSRTEEFENFSDRYFVREAFALLHDLPYQAYAKAGVFLPAFGWKLDDHTAFIRQDQSFDHERQVSGLELGFNPNYAFGHWSIYSVSPLSVGSGRLGPRSNEHDPTGWGSALHAGWRELLWQAGGSLMYEDRDDAHDLWAGANWSLNLYDTPEKMKGWELGPWTYLGELDLRRTDPLHGEAYTGLTAFHEINYMVTRSVRVLGRYDWQDRDISAKDDHRDRFTAGVIVHPFTGTEVIVEYRVNRNGGFDPMDDEALLQLHLWH